MEFKHFCRTSAVPLTRIHHKRFLQYSTFLMNKILLTTLNAKYIHLNLAIRILYDLNKDKAQLHFYEFTIKSTHQEIIDTCKEHDIVCFSCYIWNITQTLSAAQALKQACPDIKILLGGPEVSYEWQEIIAHDYIDYIILGEGEIPFEAFVTAYPAIDNVPNLVYKSDDGEVHYNKQQVQFDVQLLADRNPYQYDAVEDLYNKVLYIETSRGCPYKCEFCLASLDNKVRYLPFDTIKTNLKYLMDNGRTIKFLDRTFNIKKDFTLEIFDFILKNHHPQNVFQFEITADIIHPDIISYIQEHIPQGLFRFEIGIQTVNKDSNLAVSRKQNFLKTSSIIQQLSPYVDMHLDLIVGLPLEYYEDMKYSFEETFKLYPPELQLGFLKFLKGTPVRDKYMEHDYVFDPLPPYQIIQSKYLSTQELFNITIVENALEIYWNKARTTHALMYVSKHYSIFDFFLELGHAFIERHEFHKYTLKQVYEVFDSLLSSSTYSEDKYLKELLYIDFYTYYKVKPQDIFNVELPKAQQFEYIDTHKLNHHKFRYAIFPTSFNVHTYITTGEIIAQDDLCCIQFDGNNKAQVISSNTIPQSAQYI